jgi:hypothetical protein
LRERFLIFSFQLSAISFQLSAISYQLSAISFSLGKDNADSSRTQSNALFSRYAIKRPFSHDSLAVTVG